MGPLALAFDKEKNGNFLKSICNINRHCYSDVGVSKLTAILGNMTISLNRHAALGTTYEQPSDFF